MIVDEDANMVVDEDADREVESSDNLISVAGDADQPTEKELDDALDVLDISLCHSVTKRGRTGS